jgi:hypothetical protein
MSELKTSDGFFFLAPVLVLLSILIINDNLGFTTNELNAVLFSVRMNLLGVMILAFGIGFLAFALAGRLRMMAPSGVFMFFEGVGLVIAIVGFFAYGLAMEEIVETGTYTFFISLPQFITGLMIWAIGILLITFAGASTEKNEERMIFFVILVTLAVCCFVLAMLFPWEIVTIS